MSQLEEQSVTCPYCWESISVLLDPGDSDTSYVEDCQVCCRPVLFRLSVDARGSLAAEVSREDD